MDFISRHYEKMILGASLLFLIVSLLLVAQGYDRTKSQLETDVRKSQRSVDQGDRARFVLLMHAGGQFHGLCISHIGFRLKRSGCHTIDQAGIVSTFHITVVPIVADE